MEDRLLPFLTDVTNTRNGERGTGVWELVYSGNPPDNLIQNGGRRKQRGTREEVSPQGAHTMCLCSR